NQDHVAFRCAKKESAMTAFRATIVCLIGLLMGATADAQQKGQKKARSGPPARDPHTTGYVEAKELEDGAVPRSDADGNFIIGPTHKRAPEMESHPDVPKGTIHQLTMSSTDSKMYPGIARKAGTNVASDPTDPAKPVVTSGPAPYTRKVAVYVPK